MNAIGFEAKKLQEIADEYRARGYEVVVEPGPETTPDFLSGHRLDLIAHRAGESIVVELKSVGQAASSERYREIAETVRNHPGWKFSLVIVDPKSDEVAPLTQPLISKEEIQKRVKKSKELLQSGGPDGALLLAGLPGFVWGTWKTGKFRLCKIRNSTARFSASKLLGQSIR